MKKIILILSMLSLFTLSTQNIGVEGREVENLSPIETIDWGIGGNQTETTEVETQKSYTEESNSEEETATWSQDNETVLASPEDLVEAILMAGSETSVNYYLVQIDQEEVDIVLKALVNQGEYGYLTKQIPPLIPETFLIRTNQSGVEEAYLPIDTLINYTTDAINKYPNVYETSPVKDFYVFAQENYQKMSNKFVDVNIEDYELQDSYQEINNIRPYLLEVLQEFIEVNDEKIELQELDGKLSLILEGELSQSFTEIAHELQANYPDLADFFKLFDQTIEGTITFDYQNYEVGMGLLSNVSETKTNALEFYVQSVQTEIVHPQAESIYSKEDFNQLIGFDPLIEIPEFESQVDINAFKVEGAGYVQ